MPSIVRDLVEQFEGIAPKKLHLGENQIAYDEHLIGGKGSGGLLWKVHDGANLSMDNEGSIIILMTKNWWRHT